MKKFGSFYIASLLLISSCALAAEKDPLSLRSDVNRKTIYIGDRIRYSVEAAASEKFEVKFPDFKDGKIGDFEIKDDGKSEKTSLFAKRTYSNWYSITAYAVGKHVIPEIAVRYRQKGKKDWLEKKTKPIEISVITILPQDRAVTDIKDIKGPLYFKEFNWTLLWIFLAVLCGIGAFILLRKRMIRTPPKLPHEIAIEELEAIKGAYLKGGDIKEYYVGVSDCVRRYVERVFAFKAPEMTTEEFLNSLKDSAKLNIGQKDLLKIFLNACDLVKFAKYAPTTAEAQDVFTSAVKFIEETMNVRI